MSSDREPGSARSTLRTQATNARVEDLLKENARLRETVVGLGSIVAEAQAAGFVRVSKPDEGC